MNEIILPRRGFLAGMGALLVAPAIVKADSLMPVKSIERIFYPMRGLIAYDIGTDNLVVRIDCANFELPILVKGIVKALSQQEIKNVLALHPNIYPKLKPEYPENVLRTQRNVTFPLKVVEHRLAKKSDLFS